MPPHPLPRPADEFARIVYDHAAEIGRRQGTAMSRSDVIRGFHAALLAGYTIVAPPTLEEQIAAAISDPSMSPETQVAIEAMMRQAYDALVQQAQREAPASGRVVGRTDR